MEFWIIQDNDKLMFPVIPPSFEVGSGTLNKTVNVEQLGEVTFLAKSPPKTLKVSSFFPSQEYSFASYKDSPEPYESIELINNFKENMKPVRFIITETPINSLFSIENFSYLEQDGTRDVYFTLDLKEYNPIKAPSKIVGKHGYSHDKVNMKGANNIASTVRPVDAKPKTYTTKVGDTFPLISKKFIGNSDNWRELAEKNGFKGNFNLKPGTVIKL